MERQAAVAGHFYPADEASLRRELARCIPPTTGEGKRAVAVISPHAGYIYSGAVAGETLAAVRIPETVLVMGPSHHGRGAPAALMIEGTWRLPLGTVSIDTDFARSLLTQTSLLTDDSEAHRFEHSLEVQVPFLMYRNPGVRIVPLLLGSLSLADCETIGTAIAAAIKSHGSDVLIVASSDMSHYESRANATAKDRLAIDRVLAIDPEGLYQTVLSNRITMCGFIPATIALFAARGLGAKTAKLIRYTDSGDTSGDTTQVVGYAGLVIG